MKRVGVIGGGQLAWMMADAVMKLGLELWVQTPSRSDPAVSVAKQTILAAVDDAIATSQLATQTDVITFENEFVNLNALSLLAQQGVCFRPSLDALQPLLDKYHQRCYLRDLGLPVPQFIAVGAKHSDIESDLEAINTTTNASPDPSGVEPKHSDIESSLAAFKTTTKASPFPVVLKARRHGYDGQGTFIVKDAQTLQKILQGATAKPGLHQRPEFLIEEFIPFTQELAVIAARSPAGEIVVYPIVETQQQEQVCRRVIAPAEISPQLTAEIENIARTLLNSLNYVGLFAIELFLTPDGKVLVNEIAPRTHNSGHFSLDACHTSQFEQHLRAVCGLPLANPALTCAGAVMVNLLGFETSQSDYQAKRQQLAAIPQAYVHWYGKTESRPGRKLGHVTVLLDAANRETALTVAQQIESIWYPA